MQKQPNSECIPLPIRLKCRERQMSLLHQFPHALDAATLGFSQIGIMKYWRKRLVSGNATGRTKSLGRFKGISGIRDFNAVVIADDL